MRVEDVRLASFLSIALFALPLMAQETGSVSGTVRDLEGAALPGVAVTIDGSLIPPTTTFAQANGVYRFPTVPPGDDYSLTFRLEGFQEIVHEELSVRLGGNLQINVILTLAGVSESVLVVGESPLIDVTRTGTGNNVTERYMQSIPSARDPWVMLEHTAGVQVGSQNVGGSGSGQQDVFAANGSKLGDTVWTYDGAEITGPLGESLLYYDFDAIEEIAITTGGNDPSIVTGGVRLNFVTKRGGDSWRGSARLYATDSALQALTVGDPTTGELVGDYTADELFPGYIGNSIDNIEDFGAEFGGPAVRDRAFVWGAFSMQDIDTMIGTTPDNTQLTNWHGKVNAHFGSTVASFTFISSQKTKQGLGAGARRPAETTRNQDGLSSIYTAKVQHSFDDNNYLEATLNYTGGGFGLEPQGGRAVQASLDLATGVWGRTIGFSTTDGNSSNARLDGNSYLARTAVDHELTYGYSYRNRDRNATSGWPQGALAVFAGGTPVEAWLVGDSVDNYKQTRNSFYLADTLSIGRTTINAGLRYDHQTSVSQPSAVAPSELRPDLFPGVSFPGYDSGYAWNSLSPRLGLTYDLSGDARTVLRVNAARTYSQMQEAEFHETNITGFRELDFEWSDLNGNGSVDMGETGDPIWISSGWSPADPNAPSQNMVTETSPPWTDEFIVGVEREISRSFALGANAIFRRQGNDTWAPRVGWDDPDFWQQVTQNVAGYGPLTVYQPVGPSPNATVYKQRVDYGTSYAGIGLFLTRRFADRWMANASFDLGQMTEHFDGPGSYTDPTNIARLDGQTYSYAYSRADGYWGTANWYFKGSGMYEIGKGFSVAGYVQARQGYVNAQNVLSNTRPYGADRVSALTEDFGVTRLPTYWNLDLRAEKTFDFSSRGRLHVIVDAFNVTNNAAILGREGRLNSPYHGRITNVLQGRTIRLGLRVALR